MNGEMCTSNVSGGYLVVVGAKVSFIIHISITSKSRHTKGKSNRNRKEFSSPYCLESLSPSLVTFLSFPFPQMKVKVIKKETESEWIGVDQSRFRFLFIPSPHLASIYAWHFLNACHDFSREGNSADVEQFSLTSYFY